MSSDFLSQPLMLSKYGLIFAGVQKNVGPAGIVIVIIREDLITDNVLEGTPTMLQYKVMQIINLYITHHQHMEFIFVEKYLNGLRSLADLEAMKKMK